jgi:signal peptidase I
MQIRASVYMLSLELCEQPAPAEITTGSQTAVIDPAAQPTGVTSDTAATITLESKTEAETLSAAKTNAIASTSAQPISAQSIPIKSFASTAPSSNEAQATDARTQRRWRPSTRRLIVLACIVLGMRIFIGEASVVPTASMEGTILVGDHLFMDKLLYGPEIPLVGWRLPMLKHIHRGDIIVFRYPKDPSETFLKRVAAMGGDRVEIRDSVLYVNSQPIQEPYAVHQAAIHSPLESWGPVVVPQGRLFVMGDNRDNSSDSRDWGFVPIGNVIGSPMFVYWSYDAPTSRWLDENLEHKITFYASIAENFFSRTRWSRTGTLL